MMKSTDDDYRKIEEINLCTINVNEYNGLMNRISELDRRLRMIEDLISEHNSENEETSILDSIKDMYVYTSSKIGGYIDTIKRMRASKDNKDMFYDSGLENA